MNDKFLYLTSKYLTGEIAKAEQEELFAWIDQSVENKTAFEEIQELWSISADLEEDFETDVSVAWEKVANRTIKREATVIRFPWHKQLLRIAAVILVVAGGYWLIENWTKTAPDIIYQTAANEKTRVTLPDGSIVWLNENTKVAFAESFDPRIIKMEGEAFFDVEHLSEDQPFEIRSGNTKTTVLGTTFNVRAYPKEQLIEVTVETGKVAFEKIEKGEEGKTEDIGKETGAKVLLAAGDSGIFDKVDQAVIKKELKNENANSWKTGQLTFQNTEMKDVKEALERFFDIKINTSDEKILNCHITGIYQKPELDEILEVLKFSLNIEIEKNQNEFTLNGEGCN